MAAAEKAYTGPRIDKVGHLQYLSAITGVEPDPCSLYFLAKTTFVLVILAKGQKSL